LCLGVLKACIQKALNTKTGNERSELGFFFVILHQQSPLKSGAFQQSSHPDKAKPQLLTIQVIAVFLFNVTEKMVE